MAMNLITSVLSLGIHLLPLLKASALAPPPSSYNNNSEKERRAVEEDLERLIRTLERIEATLSDAEEREISDSSVKNWLKELKKLAYDAENVLGEYRYEATRVKVLARMASQASGAHKRKQMEYVVTIPDGMVDRLNKIRSLFDEIAKDRDALRLTETDGVVRCPNKIKSQSPMGYKGDEISIFGRDSEVKEVVKLILSENEKFFSVISIIGKVGLGKTTIAQLVYKDTRICQCFDLFGWVCISEDFNVARIIKETIESFTSCSCDLSELSPLQEELAEVVKDKRIFLVLDDVWNEKQCLWDLFKVPLNEAKWARILVTTRNEKVAEVMLAAACFHPTYLPEDSCWQLFQQYAFGSTSSTVPTRFIEMGREIMRKCGGLPLAVKSIASLLRHETDEESWREILESDFWASNSSNEIFPALQINYAHLPPYLKPCFLFCSMFPKGHEISRDNLIELWISHGYVKSTAKRTIREVGSDYYEELRERSFIDVSPGQNRCKLNDIIHDLARVNSEKEHWSVEINQEDDIQEVTFPQEVIHLYVRGFTGYVNQILQQNLQRLRTLSTDLRGCREFSEHQYCIHSTEFGYKKLELLEDYGDCWENTIISDLTKFEALRVLELKGNRLREIPGSIVQLKNLCHLHVTSDHLTMLPESIGHLYNLHTLILDCWSSPLELPKSIGYLANLQYLCIKSAQLKNLPNSFGLLTNLTRLVLKCEKLEVASDISELRRLQELTIDARLNSAFLDSISCLSNLEELCMGTPLELPDVFGKCHKLTTLKISGCSIIYNTHSLRRFPAMREMAACLRVSTMSWLKEMKDLRGQLIIEGLQNTSDLKDAENADLKSKCRIETLDLCWHDNRTHSHFDGLEMVRQKELTIRISNDSNDGTLIEEEMNFHLLECLQPHCNLKKLVLEGYPSAAVPGWMGDPLSLQAIHEIILQDCSGLRSLPFSNLHTLKHLQLCKCLGLRLMLLENLPSKLEILQISSCDEMELIAGLLNLNMLTRLEINNCIVLKSITMDQPQLAESTKPFGNSSHEMAHDGCRGTSSLKELVIRDCPMLHALPHELLQSGPRYVAIVGCGYPDLDLRNPSVR